MPNTTNKMTIEKLAVLIQDGFAEQSRNTKQEFVKQSKNTEEAIAELAAMVQRGFTAQAEQTQQGFAEHTEQTKRAINELAVMTHKGFTEQTEALGEVKKELVEFRKENQQQHKQMRREYVPRSEFLETRAKI